jgi:hypothetical protein
MEIPAYVASRLEGEELRRLQDHLAVCDTCREMASIFKEIAVALREGGDAMFDPHPGTLALRGFAQGKTVPGGDRIALHVAACPSCGLEVQAWRSRPEAMAGRLSHAKPGRREGYGRTAWAAAAGLLAGLGLAFWLLRTAPVPVAPPAAPEVTRHPETAWSGPAPQLILPRALRGEPSRVAYTVGKDQKYLVVAFPASPGAAAADADLYRFVAVRQDGAVTWSSRLTAAEMREHLDSTEVVTFVVPAAALVPGTYEFRVMGPGERASYSVTVEISAAE